MAPLQYDGVSQDNTPSTPTKTFRSDPVSEIVEQLNQEFPLLELPPWSTLISSSSRPRTLPNICCTRINDYFLNEPERLSTSLDSFKRQAFNCADSLQTILLKHLPPLPASKCQQATSAATSGRRTERQSKSFTSQPGMMYDRREVSPSPSKPRNQRHAQAVNGIARGTKRPAVAARADTSSKIAKISPPSRDVLRINAQTLLFEDDDDFEYSLCPSSASLKDLLQAARASEVVPNSNGLTKTLPTPASSTPFYDTGIEGINHTAKRSLGNDSVPIGTSKTWPTTTTTTESIAKVETPTRAFQQLDIRSTRRKLAARPEALSRPALPVSSEKSLKSPTSEPLVSFQVKNMHQDNFFVPDCSASSIDFKYLWEAQRFAQAANLPIEHFMQCSTPDRDYKTFMDNLTKAFPQDSKMPVKSSQICWQPHEDECVQYKAEARFSKTRSAATLYTLSLRPLVRETSSRMQRKFESSRVMYMYFPNKDKLPKHFDGEKHFEDHFIRFLMSPKHFLGRVWRAVHLMRLKDEKKKKKIEMHRGHRVVFLAISGEGISTLTIGDFMDWHIDTTSEKNLDQLFRKGMTRLDLGFSKTTPTHVFKPSQVVYIRDVYADGTREPTEFNEPCHEWQQLDEHNDAEPPIMTDGVAQMSVAAAKLIWARLGGDGPLPAAFQGRIGCAKGMWVRSGNANSQKERDSDVWIEIRDSQLKLEPHAADFAREPDPHRWTFEVVSFVASKSEVAMRGSLHMDMIPLLCDRGVNIADIRAVVAEAMSKEEGETHAMLSDPKLALEWVHRHHGNPEARGSTDRRWEAINGFPNEPHEKAKKLLHSDFLPDQEPNLRDALAEVVKNYFSRALQKISLPMVQSANLKGVADPLGVLEAGTIHVSLSNPINDPTSGERVCHLDGLIALITRHPMMKPSDIQKVRIVHHPELAHLKDCVVFPTKGTHFLCSKLQGGDLDGDDYTVIWDPRLVNQFKNAPSRPATIPFQHFRISQDRRTLRDLLRGPEPFDNILQEYFRARIKDDPLGQLVKFIKKTAYQIGPTVYQSPLFFELCEFHTFLIDADKNGYKCSAGDVDKYIREHAGIVHKKPPKPEYEKFMDAGSISFAAGATHQWTHPNDIVYFEEVISRIERIIEPFIKRDESSKPYKDQVLAKLYEDYLQLDDKEMRKELKGLEKDIHDISKRWNALFAPKPDCKPVGEKDSKDVGEILDRLRAKYNDIKSKHPRFVDTSLYHGSDRPSEWALLRASALYTLLHTRKSTKIIFQLAGPELCYMKVQARPLEMVTRPLMDIYKPRLRKKKVVLASERAPREGILDLETDEFDELEDHWFEDDIDDDEF